MPFRKRIFLWTFSDFGVDGREVGGEKVSKSAGDGHRGRRSPSRSSRGISCATSASPKVGGDHSGATLIENVGVERLCSILEEAGFELIPTSEAQSKEKGTVKKRTALVCNTYLSGKPDEERIWNPDIRASPTWLLT